MWVPETVEQIEAAVRNGDLTETPSFDGKRELPPRHKNASLAVDVAAMSTEGGVLLYGVGEDEQGLLTIVSPIPLKGAADRVAQIVQNAISEVPFIDTREYPCPDDSSHGYLVVVVPPSARAPHQVKVGDDLRYYGRGAKGNRQLLEGEIAMLYERRRSWTVSADAVLAEVVANSPVPAQSEVGYVHAFARPVAEGSTLMEDAIERLGGEDATHERFREAARVTRLGGTYGPTLETARRWGRRGADMWRLSTYSEEDYLHDPESVDGVTMVMVNLDGRGQHFCGRATDRHIGGGPAVILEVIIAGNVAAFLSIMGVVYRAAGYHGAVDVGVALTGLKGAHSHERGEQGRGHLYEYPADSFTRTARVAAAELEGPSEVAHRLLRHFYEATSGRPRFNPFEQHTRP